MRALTGALSCALLIAGCGGSDKKSAEPKGTPDPAAKSAAQAYLDAYTAKDAKKICGLLIPKVQKQLADNKGTCVKTMRFSIKTGSFPRQVVAKALAQGSLATATVTGSDRQIKLQKVAGSWKVYDGGN